MNQKDICFIMQARVPTMRTLRSHHKIKKRISFLQQKLGGQKICQENLGFSANNKKKEVL
jgi:hypothetical protein